LSGHSIVPPDIRFAAVVLAAQRSGQLDPLAEQAGVSHKCLVPIAGREMIACPIEALRATPGLERLRIVVEPDAETAIRALPLAGGAPLEFVPAADNLADSVHAAAHDLDLPLVVTTADNVLLTPAAIRQVLDALANGADVGLAMSTKDAALAAHPEGQRRFYRFSDDEYSNCNLYGLGGRAALKAAEGFRSGGQFAKKPSRLVAAVGLINVILMRLGRLSLAGALRRMSRRPRLRIDPVVIADGSHAIDVDNERTYRVASLLLEARRTASSLS
jgi:GTP:adenosylcobinamide-phosphate guanylyltransferase